MKTISGMNIDENLLLPLGQKINHVSPKNIFKKGDHSFIK